MEIDKQKDKLLNITIIAVALIVAFNIYRGQVKSIDALKVNKDAEIKRNELLADISKLEKKVTKYKTFINNKDITAVINNIGNIAQQCDVKIALLRPEREEDRSMYIKYPFYLTVSAGSYHALGRFISKLESYQDIYIVDSVMIRQVKEEIQNTQEAGLRGVSPANKLVADLKVSTILFKD